MKLENLIGNQTATKCLLFIARYEEAPTSEIVKAFNLPRAQVFIQLKKLEENEILISRTISNVRLYSLNPRSNSVKALKTFLEAYIEESMSPEKDKEFFLVRRRPRTRGKDLKGAYQKASDK